MMIRKLTTAFAIVAVCAGGSAVAQTQTSTGAQSTTPSNTPNDSSATPPNTAVPQGAATPALVHSSQPSPSSTTPVAPISKEPRGNAPSKLGNTESSPTQGGAAPYTGQRPQK